MMSRSVVGEGVILFVTICDRRGEVVGPNVTSHLDLDIILSYNNV